MADRVVLWWYDGGDPKSTSVCELLSKFVASSSLHRWFFLSFPLLSFSSSLLVHSDVHLPLSTLYLLRLYSELRVPAGCAIPKLNTADDSRALPPAASARKRNGGTVRIYICQRNYDSPCLRSIFSFSTFSFTYSPSSPISLPVSFSSNFSGKTRSSVKKLRER